MTDDPEQHPDAQPDQPAPPTPAPGKEDIPAEPYSPRDPGEYEEWGLPAPPDGER